MRRAETLAGRLALVTLTFACFAAPAHANEKGPLSGGAQTGCGNGCHGDAENPMITLEAPSVVDEVPTPFVLHFDVEDELVGGGGFMIEASDGRIDVEPGRGLRKSAAAEASHDGTRPLDRSWSVTWTLDGPVPGCAIDLRLAAMATDFNEEEDGDSWGVVSSQIALVPSADETPPAAPVFERPVAGSIVNAGKRVGTFTAPTTVVVEWVELRVVANDDTGVREVVLFDVDVTGEETRLGAATYDRKTRHWVLRWNTEGATPGPHTIRAVATDCAGHVAESTLEVVAF